MFLGQIGLATIGSPLLVWGAGAIEAESVASVDRSGIRGQFSCDDVSDLSDEQIKVRKALAYTDTSPHEDKPCDACKFFQAPSEGKQCGGCTAVPGPIHPRGYCTAWVAG